MSTKNRSFLLFSMVPAVLLSSVLAVAQAADAKATKWSDPATWPNKKVPAAGDKVEIASGRNVILDVSPPALGGLTINGKLSFANTADLELSTEWVMIHGELAIGTLADPLGDPVAVHRGPGQGLEDQDIDRALEQSGLTRHSMPHSLSTHHERGEYCPLAWDAQESVKTANREEQVSRLWQLKSASLRV